MNHRLFALVAATVLAVAAPATGSFARDRVAPAYGDVPASRYDDITTGSIRSYDAPVTGRCADNSASQGNANQQNFPVQQYGQTSGGPRC
ncbi:hypothetical protein ASF58_14035 [Methylobacterium sp. Leaf125]|uniref:hypothetical protein n=1 Tax=Methylobacterium sp. Leaf125 TaxID=1736265 RepID=UPI0006FE7A34|nr:hypothetical protein [Methylobacterium sp. Leaf125]KQQ26029.1 hypothetical protein ASF58_14035 [Methylobacterium sp. Leaf125]